MFSSVNCEVRSMEKNFFCCNGVPFLAIGAVGLLISGLAIGAVGLLISGSQPLVAQQFFCTSNARLSQGDLPPVDANRNVCNFQNNGFGKARGCSVEELR